MGRVKQHGNDVAIIGMDCWYPGSESLLEFWENILSKRQQFRRMPDVRLPLSVYQSSDRSVPDKTYGTEAAVIDGFSFDWQDRRIPKKVVDATDIVHWLALEVALKALEHSRLDLGTLQKGRTGVILGNTLTGEWTRTNAMRMRWPFFERVLRETAAHRGLSSEGMTHFIDAVGVAFKSVFPDVTEDTLAGALSNTIAGRICNFLDLHGGGYTVDGACSSSLIAVITAARNLASGDLDVAFAGGIDISLDTFELIGFAKTGALTSDEMRVYDRRANGFVPGEGCGFVVLKRLEDAVKDGDRVLAVIRGWGISSDGKGGLTAPSVDGQAMAIGDAYKMAGYGLDQVDFIEGHGTGTTVGDKVEISALVKVLGGLDPRQSIGMTSLKTIIGHTKAAAGIGALIKAAIAVNQRVVPPLAGVEEPNPIFSDKAKSFYPVIEGEQREASTTLKAGVSAMGFGGINSHVTIESFGPVDPMLRPSIDTESILNSHDKREVFVFSARSQALLGKKLETILPSIRRISRAEMVDLAYDCAQRVRPTESYRAIVIASKPEEAYTGIRKLIEWQKEKLAKESCREETEGTTYIGLSHVNKRPRLAFLFPGQGAQRVNMGRRLVRRYPWARSMAEKAEKIYREVRGTSLTADWLFRPGILSEEESKRINQTEAAQPAISLVNAMWFEAMSKFGVSPDVVAGHSLGELSALYAGKAISFDDLISLAAHRGSLMGQKAGRVGTMIYIAASRSDATELMKDAGGYVTIANLNAPDQTVLSGDPDALKKILEKAKARGLQGGALPVSNAFHSEYMTEAAKAFSDILRDKSVSSTMIPFVRGTDGQMANEALGGDDLRSYLSRQIVENVDFISTLETIKSRCDLILEVGPGSILTGLARRNAGSNIPVYNVESRPDADSDFKVALAGVFLHGGNVRWLEIFRDRFVRPLTLPEARTFIESPTERPLELAPVELSTRKDQWILATQPEISMSVGAKTPILEATRPVAMSSELKVRKDDNPPVEEASSDAVTNVAQLVPPKSTDPVSKKSADGVGVSIIEKEICSYIAEQTGFDPATLKPDLRLLDDLNLDSIKVTDLVGNVSIKFGVAGELTPSAYSNATVRELALAIKDRLEVASSPSSSSSASSVQPGTQKSAPVKSEGAKDIGVREGEARDRRSPGGDGSMASVTAFPVGGKRVAVAPAANEQGPQIAEVSRSKNKPAWVRDFVELYEKSPLPVGRKWSWQGVKVGLVGIEGDGSSLGRYQEVLVGLGADVRMRLFKGGEQFIPDLGGCEVIITFMPEVKSQGDRDDLVSVGLLSGVARAQGTKGASFAFVQFDDGRFGQSKTVGRIHSAKAFAQSLAHEEAQSRVRILSLHEDWEEQFPWVMSRLGDELGQAPRVSVVGYDEKGERFVPRLKLTTALERENRNIPWHIGDVILVTGGGKGITAECALAFAKQFQTTMILVGSTPLQSSDKEDPNHPVTATLKRYSDAGLIAHYFNCDISSEQSVIGLVQGVREKIGEIRGIIHGAGTNYPRPASTVDPTQAMREIGPKLVGMRHLLSAVREDELKLIVGLTSVIGVVGMPGNAWYGFANESLDLILRSYATLHPHVQTQTCAFSVWSEVGMGARLGSDKNLEAKGIGSIGVEEGTKHFLRLMTHRSSDQQVVTTSRLGIISQDGQNLKSMSDLDYNFVHDVLHFQSGVEVIAKTKLTLDKHVYLRDHNYKGAYLFPTVFGLEAMAQAVMQLTDLRLAKSFVIQNIKLSRPITVGVHGTDIEIYAEMAEGIEPDAHGGGVLIKAGIRTAATGYRYDHFCAEFVLGDIKDETIDKIPNFERDLGIKPQEQLYGSVLFQGPLFQRIRAIHHLESDNETAGCLVFKSEVSPSVSAKNILGDPYFRDTLLQSAQLVIPQNQCLPIEIEKIEFNKGLDGARAAGMAFTDVKKSDEQSYLATVTVFDSRRQVLQKMTNYRLRFLEKKPQFPRAMDLIPSSPEVGHLAGVGLENAGSKQQDLLDPYRHIASQLVIDAEPNGPQGQSVFVHRFIPDFKTFSNLSRSIYFSHIFNWMGWAREMSSVPVLDRIRALTETGRWGLVTNWASIEVLGECRNKNRVVEARMWCGKVSGSQNSSAVLTFDWVSKGDNGIEERIAVGRMGFTWVEIYGHGLVRPAPFPDYYRDFIASMVAQNDAPDTFIETAEPYRSLETGDPIYAPVVGPSGGIPIAEKVFDTYLFDANLVGNLYFGNYSIWMGKLRDLAFFRMAPEIYRGVGELGEFTCVNSRIQHLREAMPFDDIIVTMTLKALHKKGMDLIFEFQKKLPDGKGEKLAMGEHRVIWTKMDAKGEKVAVDLPEKIVTQILALVAKHTLGAAG